jgi:hypothetical protein
MQHGNSHTAERFRCRAVSMDAIGPHGGWATFVRAGGELHPDPVDASPDDLRRAIPALPAVRRLAEPKTLLRTADQ